ncbi:MAG: hypothetical protein U0996_16725 [Planctomycetaceae bacterium]
MGIDLLDVSFRLERATGVAVSQSDWASLVKDGDILVGDLYSLLLCRLSKDTDECCQLWLTVKDCLVNALGVDDREVTMEARLIRDLGAV